MKTYLYLSDIHGNFEALKHLKDLPEMSDPDCHIRFGGDYIDGIDLQPNAIINTLRFIKDLCDSGKAKAVIGNHDDFILRAAFNPLDDNWWYMNGRKETLENLGITYSSPGDLREQLLHFYHEELNWLNQLPLYLEDGKNILVHAGFDLDLALADQDYETMLWTREPYINPPVDIHDDFDGKTIITGHTPTGLIKEQNNPNQNHPILSGDVTDVDGNRITRYFIDGGSKSGSQKGVINLLKLDENGKELWCGYLDANGVHEVN